MIFNIKYTIANFLATVILLVFVSCDHLRQSNDEVAKTPPTGDPMKQVDPEYIKRELRDIINTKIDVDKDKHVSYQELRDYLIYKDNRDTDYYVKNQWLAYEPQIHEVFSWEGYEPEKKEVLTWEQYFNRTYPELIGVNIGLPTIREQDTSGILTPTKTEDSAKKEADKAQQSAKHDAEPLDPHLESLKRMVYRADERWKLADENGDTLLTQQEFKFLLFPEEGNEAQQNEFVRESTEDMDLNKDGNICLDEFMKYVKESAHDDQRNNSDWLMSQQWNFGQFLDKNKDGVLEEEEIKNWLVPSKSAKFGSKAKNYMEIGDKNEDHKLSMAEILDHFEYYVAKLLPSDFWPKSDSEFDGSNLAVDESMYPIDVDHDEL